MEAEYDLALRESEASWTFVVAGLVLSTPARRLLDQGWTRHGRLAVAIGARSPCSARH